MADQEIIKHTKKVYNIWTSKNHSLWHKIKEFVLEVFIIVFAVSVSIWLHSWSEHRHQQQEVREFLADLKEDLLQDIKNMQEQKKGTQESIYTFKKLIQITATQIDSLDAIPLKLMPNSRKTNSGNYEGFKSSGNIGFIENKKLKNLILNYYQQDILALEQLEEYYNNQLFKLQDLASIKKSKKEFILDKTVKFTLSYLIQYGQQRIDGYEQLILHTESIIKKIDAELK